MCERFSRWICRNLHPRITRPVCGEYICLRCQRRFPVLWQMPIAAPKVGGRFDFQATGYTGGPSNAATGLPEAKAGLMVPIGFVADSPLPPLAEKALRETISRMQVAELERLLSLDRPTGVE